MRVHYDRIIIGAGIYGLYSALYCGEKGEKILVLECENEPFTRATYINQARVHMGYHYPRSLSTALRSKEYFERFCRDYDFCILKTFDQIYATSSNFSWTNGDQFKRFCTVAGIDCSAIDVNDYFNKGACDQAFLTKEYTYDAQLLKKYFLDKISQHKNVEIKYNFKIERIDKETDCYVINGGSESEYASSFLLNATYAGVNQINEMAGYKPFNIKYELCEIILCRVNENLKGKGITVMDGPFFSIMPFGKTGLHSLTSVTFTPHDVSYSDLPVFKCQEYAANCSEKSLGNCNNCEFKPKTAFGYMSNLAKKYLREDYKWEYEKSLFSMKPILTTSEIDDSRPTLIKVLSENPTFISVLSGKINTVYDLDEVLNYDK